MSKVYFIKARKNNTPEKISDDAANLFQIFIEREQIRLAEKLPLKVHFGEKGNQTFIPPSCFEGRTPLLWTRPAWIPLKAPWDENISEEGGIRCHTVKPLGWDP